MPGVSKVTDPVLVEVLRGSLVESQHRGAVFVCDDAGKAVLELGDVDRPTFPRSAVKSMQALPFVESGAADAFGFGDRELALACASHTGEPEHAALAASMLGAAGLTEGALECGTHWPSSQQATVELASEGGHASQLHNNCSGKHSGFLCTCRHMGLDHHGYIRAEHWMQETVRQAMEDVTGASLGPDNRGVDGCGIPTYAVPLRNLARGFAKMATGRGLAAKRADAARRLMNASMNEPFLVAGTGKADTAIMGAGEGRIFCKHGAEGVHIAALPELGLGVAIKCDDGSARASEAALAGVLARLFKSDADLAHKLTELANPVLKNWNGTQVGALRPSAALA